MRLGPVQLLVVSFGRPDFGGEVLAEFERLRQSEAVRVIDLLVVRKDADGLVQRVHHPDLADRGVVAALLGLGAAGTEEAEGGAVPAEAELWSLDQAIPSDSAALIALVEHRWAIGARDAIGAAGGVPVADAWVHPDDLVAAGLTDAGAAGRTSAPSAT